MGYLNTQHNTMLYTPLPSLLASPQPAPDTLPPSWPPGVLATAPWCSERRQPSERRRERPHASLALATHRDCQRSLPLVEEGLHVGRSGAAPVEAFVVADAVTHSSSAHLASSQSCQSPKRSTATITRISHGAPRNRGPRRQRPRSCHRGSHRRGPCYRHHRR